MPMRQFLFRRTPHLGDLDIEEEGLPRQRVIAIHRHEFRADLLYCHGGVAPGLRPGLQRHARTKVRDPAEGGARHLLGAGGVVLSISFRRTNAHLQFVAGVPAEHFALKARHDLSVPVEVGHGFPMGLIDDGTGFVLEYVMERDDRVLGYFHWQTRKASKIGGCAV
jgi:hypothetical protein